MFILFFCMQLVQCAQKPEQKKPDFSAFHKFQQTPEYKEAENDYLFFSKLDKNPDFDTSAEDEIEFAIINGFIDKVMSKSYDKVREILKYDKKLLSLLDTFSAQQALKEAEKLDDKNLMRNLLLSNQQFALLSGPNGPLIMALQKTHYDEHKPSAVNGYLKYAQALYHKLSPQQCFEALIQASICDYSDFIIAPLLKQPYYVHNIKGESILVNHGLLSEIKRNQVEHLLFIAFAKNDRATINALFDDQGTFAYINRTYYNLFISSALKLPRNKAFVKSTGYFILRRLFEDKNFIIRLKQGLREIDHLEDELRSMLNNCLEDQFTIVHATTIIKIVLADGKLKKYLPQK